MIAFTQITPIRDEVVKKITIKDVAAQAGVSTAAVSRAFQADGRIAEVTRDRVFQAARELDYRPSPIARGLAHQRSRLVTLLTGPAQSAFDVQFFDALTVALAQTGRHLMVVNIGHESEVDDGLWQAIDYKSEAIIASAGTMSLESSSRCVSAGIPLILAGRALDAPGVTSVLAQNVEGGRLAGTLLARLAKGPLCFFGNGGRTFSDRERFEGFAGAIAEAGLPPPIEFAAPAGDETQLQRAAMDFLSSPDRPSAIFCANDGLAIAVLQAAMLLGLSVPDDLAVVGFDNVPMAGWPVFDLTTIDYPVAELVENIIAAMGSDSVTEGHRVIRVPVRLVVRRTTPRALPAPGPVVS